MSKRPLSWLRSEANELGVQEWTIIVGVIIGVTLLLWLAARWRKRRYDDIYSYDSSDDDSDSDYISELPSGGARTVGYRDPTDIERTNSEIRERADKLKPKLSSFSAAPREQQPLFEEAPSDESSDSTEEQVPLLLDPSEEHSEGFELEQETTSGSKPAGDEEPESMPEEQQLSEMMAEEKPAESEVEKSELVKDTDTKKSAEDLNESGKAPETKSPRQKKETKDRKNAAPVSDEPPEIIVINLMTSPDASYEGQPLLRALTELGMRFGEMDIFHYCGTHGNEQPRFSMANLLNPGVFDINKIAELRTHALCFFFELDVELDNLAVYESMLSVISKLKDELGGEMRDDQRSVFTIQTSEHCRQRIRDFQRRHLVKKA